MTAQSGSDLAARVAALEAQNRAILKELQELRAMLQGRAGLPQAPLPAGANRTPLPPQRIAATGPDVDLNIQIAGRPVKGKPDSKVVLVEFSDFECPFCGRYARETAPQVVKAFVDTGRVKYVFMNYPIPSLHPRAQKAAEAAECAFAQGKFWEMHDRLFTNQQALDLPQLLVYGQGMGMDRGRFESCMSGQASSQVQRDRDAGMRTGMTGTPTFFAGTLNADGSVHATRMWKGAAPFETFRTYLEAVLSQVKH